MSNVSKFSARSGRMLREDGSVINAADVLDMVAKGQLKVQLDGDSIVIDNVDIGAEIGIKDGENKLKVNADGSIDTKLTGSIDEDGLPVKMKSPAQVTLQNEQTSTNTGPAYDVSGCESVIFTVEGEFEGTVGFFGRRREDSPLRRITPFIDIDTGRFVTVASKPGNYYVDVSGYSVIHARVDSYTSGAVTVKARAFTTKSDDFERRRNVEIQRVISEPVDAGSSKYLPNIDISDYVFTYVAVRADSGHEYVVNFSYLAKNLNDGMPEAIMPSTIVIEGDSARAVSEWEEVKGEAMRVQIENKDDADHTYHVVLYGVR